MELRVYEMLTAAVAFEGGEAGVVVSDPFRVVEASALAFQIEADGVVNDSTLEVKLQGSMSPDPDTFTDIDNANAKIDVVGDDGVSNQRLAMNAANPTFTALFPMPTYIRFVVSAGAADAMNLKSIKVQS